MSEQARYRAVKAQDEQARGTRKRTTVRGFRPSRLGASSEQAPPSAADVVSGELLTDLQLAERWQLSRGTLANQRSQGRGPAYLKICGRVRYRRSDVEAYEREGFVETRSTALVGFWKSREGIELLIRSAGE